MFKKIQFFTLLKVKIESYTVFFLYLFIGILVTLIFGGYAYSRLTSTPKKITSRITLIRDAKAFFLCCLKKDSHPSLDLSHPSVFFLKVILCDYFFFFGPPQASPHRSQPHKQYLISNKNWILFVGFRFMGLLVAGHFFFVSYQNS